MTSNGKTTLPSWRLLDFAVREEGVPPPIKLPVFFGRISLGNLINTSLILVFFWYGFREWGWWGFWGLWIPACEIVMQLGDVLSSNASSRNIQNLRSQGYSDFTILAYHQINMIQTQLLSFLVCGILAPLDPKMDDWQYVVEERLMGDGLTILRRILTTMICAEVAFTLGHGLLHAHPKFMEIHVFHHCCTTPSFATNLLFHPVDLIIEFSGPLLFVLGLNLWFARHDDHLVDGVTLLATYTVFQLWYAWDHDEHLNLAHIKHHRQCNSNFSVYVEHKMSHKWNPLQKNMQSRNDLDWGNEKPRGKRE